MTATRLAAALALGSVLGISCYSEPLPPSTYRYACEADGDCNANESCRHGHCERPCTQLTAAEDCPSAEGFIACFNGACATTCAVGSDYCTPGQTCIDLGIDLGGASNPFGGGSDAAVGICGLECDADDNADICPEGEICIVELGACAVDCSQGQACPGGYSCVFGVCAPLDSLPSGDSSGEPATTTDGGSTSAMGSTGDPTSGATGDSAGSTTAMGAEPDDEERR